MTYHEVEAAALGLTPEEQRQLKESLEQALWATELARLAQAASAEQPLLSDDELLAEIRGRKGDARCDE